MDGLIIDCFAGGGEAMTANEIAAKLADRGQKVSRSDVGPILTKAQAAGKSKKRRKEGVQRDGALRNHLDGRIGCISNDCLLE